MTKHMHGLSDQIRSLAEEKFVQPALRSGKSRFPIAVKDLMCVAEASGIRTKDRVPAFCTSIRKRAFLEKNRLRVLSVEGPDSGKSTTVVVHYEREASDLRKDDAYRELQETPEARAFRLTEKMRGLLRDEIASRGGTEAFMCWVRSSEDAK